MRHSAAGLGSGDGPLMAVRAHEVCRPSSSRFGSCPRSLTCEVVDSSRARRVGEASAPSWRGLRTDASASAARSHNGEPTCADGSRAQLPPLAAAAAPPSMAASLRVVSQSASGARLLLSSLIQSAAGAPPERRPLLPLLPLTSSSASLMSTCTWPDLMT